MGGGEFLGSGEGNIVPDPIDDNGKGRRQKKLANDRNKEGGGKRGKKEIELSPKQQVSEAMETRKAGGGGEEAAPFVVPPVEETVASPEAPVEVPAEAPAPAAEAPLEAAPAEAPAPESAGQIADADLQAEILKSVQEQVAAQQSRPGLSQEPAEQVVTAVETMGDDHETPVSEPVAENVENTEPSEALVQEIKEIVDKHNKAVEEIETQADPADTLREEKRAKIAQLDEARDRALAQEKSGKNKPAIKKKHAQNVALVNEEFDPKISEAEGQKDQAKDVALEEFDKALLNLDKQYGRSAVNAAMAKATGPAAPTEPIAPDFDFGGPAPIHPAGPAFEFPKITTETAEDEQPPEGFEEFRAIEVRFERAKRRLDEKYQTKSRQLSNLNNESSYIFTDYKAKKQQIDESHQDDDAKAAQIQALDEEYGSKINSYQDVRSALLDEVDEESGLSMKEEYGDIIDEREAALSKLKESLGEGEFAKVEKFIADKYPSGLISSDRTQKSVSDFDPEPAKDIPGAAEPAPPLHNIGKPEAEPNEKLPQWFLDVVDEYRPIYDEYERAHDDWRARHREELSEWGRMSSEAKAEGDEAKAKQADEIYDSLSQELDEPYGRYRDLRRAMWQKYGDDVMPFVTRYVTDGTQPEDRLPNIAPWLTREEPTQGQEPGAPAAPTSRLFDLGESEAVHSGEVPQWFLTAAEEYRTIYDEFQDAVERHRAENETKLTDLGELRRRAMETGDPALKDQANAMALELNTATSEAADRYGQKRAAMERRYGTETMASIERYALDGETPGPLPEIFDIDDEDENDPLSAEAWELGFPKRLFDSILEAQAKRDRELEENKRSHPEDVSRAQELKTTCEEAVRRLNDEEEEAVKEEKNPKKKQKIMESFDRKKSAEYRKLTAGLNKLDDEYKREEDRINDDYRYSIFKLKKAYDEDAFDAAENYITAKQRAGEEVKINEPPRVDRTVLENNIDRYLHDPNEESTLDELDPENIDAIRRFLGLPEDFTSQDVEATIEQALLFEKRYEIDEAAKDRWAKVMEFLTSAREKLLKAAEEIKEQAQKEKFDQKFPVVKVIRSSGEQEDDWRFTHFDGEKSKIHVIKLPDSPDGKMIDKYVSVEDFIKLNPELADRVQQEADEFEKQKAEKIQGRLEARQRTEGAQAEKKFGGPWGNIKRYTRNFAVRAGIMTVMGVSTNMVGGNSIPWILGRAAASGLFGKEGTESLWLTLKTRGLDVESARDKKTGEIDWAKVDEDLKKLKEEKGDEALLELLAKGEIKFSEKGQPIASALAKKNLEARQQREKYQKFKALISLREKWQKMPPRARTAITLSVLGVMLASSAIPGVNAAVWGTAASVAAKVGLAKAGIVGASVVRFGAMSAVNGLLGYLNKDADITKEMVEQSELYEHTFKTLCDGKSDEDIDKVNGQIQERVTGMERSKSKWGKIGFAGGAIVSLGLSAVKAHTEGKAEAQAEAQKKALEQSSQVKGATPRSLPEPGAPGKIVPHSLAEPGAHAGAHPGHPEQLSEQAFKEKVAAADLGSHFKGSDSLAAEKALAGGSLKGHDGNDFMGKIYDGLIGKHQLSSYPDAHDKDKIVGEMIAKAKEMGIIDAHGHLTNRINADAFNPLEFTRAVHENNDAYLATLTAQLAGYEHAHNAAMAHVVGIPESSHTGAANMAHGTEVKNNLAVEPASYTWRTGSSAEYLKGIKCTPEDVKKILASDVLGKDAKAYLEGLLNGPHHVLRPEQVVISLDGKHVMFANTDLSNNVTTQQSVWASKPIGGGFLGLGKHSVMAEILKAHQAVEPGPTLSGPQTAPAPESTTVSPAPKVETPVTPSAAAPAVSAAPASPEAGPTNGAPK